MKKLMMCVLMIAVLGAGCGKQETKNETQEASPQTPAGDAAQKKETALTGRISISGAWALYPMVVKWAEEFKKLNPGVTIDISAGGAGKGVTDALTGTVDLGMVSRDINPTEMDKGAWWVSVVKDAVVPTMNDANPDAAAIAKRGVTGKEFTDIWVSEKLKSWNDITGGKGDNPIHVYTRSDACGAAETWAKYLGGKQEDLQGTGVYGDPGIAEAVRKDNLGIGFNNLNFAYDLKTKKPLPGLAIIPIDVNSNKTIDVEESFYRDADSLVKAIGDGRYPSPPARDLHLVSQGVPKKELVVAFIRWMLTDGQKFVLESGYIQLPQDKLDAGLKKLDGK